MFCINREPHVDLLVDVFTISSKYLLKLILVVRYLIDFIRSGPLLQLLYLAACVVYVAQLGGPAPSMNQSTPGICYLHEYFANRIFWGENNWSFHRLNIVNFLVIFILWLFDLLNICRGVRPSGRPFEPISAQFEQKLPVSFDEILQAKAILGKYLMAKCYSEHYPQLFVKYFLKIILNTKVIVKSILDPDMNGLQSKSSSLEHG